MKNYYQILGFDSIVSTLKIEKRHLKLTEDFIRNRHNGAEYTQDFIDQSEAFYLLIHPKWKVKYDELFKIKFENKSISKTEKAKKWELKIALESVQARELAEDLAQLSNKELEARNNKLEKRSWKTVLRNVGAFILDIFVTIS